MLLKQEFSTQTTRRGDNNDSPLNNKFRSEEIELEGNEKSDKRDSPSFVTFIICHFNHQFLSFSDVPFHTHFSSC